MHELCRKWEEKCFYFVRSSVAGSMVQLLEEFIGFGKLIAMIQNVKTRNSRAASK
jgi:hypothetical protein